MTRLASLVLYRLNEQDIERINQMQPGKIPGRPLHPGDQVAMVITRDWAPSDLVNGTLMLDADFTLRVTSVAEGDAPGRWKHREA